MKTRFTEPYLRGKARPRFYLADGLGTLESRQTACHIASRGNYRRICQITEFVFASELIERRVTLLPGLLSAYIGGWLYSRY